MRYDRQSATRKTLLPSPYRALAELVRALDEIQWLHPALPELDQAKKVLAARKINKPWQVGDRDRPAAE